MRIGILPDPTKSRHWPAIASFLAPAARRGCIDTLIGPLELLWAAFEGDTPLAAATTRLTEDDTVEIVLVGGVDHRKWLQPLDEMIGRAAKDTGATCLRAFGRKGWRKALGNQGWMVMYESGGLTAYERNL